MYFRHCQKRTSSMHSTLASWRATLGLAGRRSGGEKNGTTKPIGFRARARTGAASCSRQTATRLAFSWPNTRSLRSRSRSQPGTVVVDTVLGGCARSSRPSPRTSLIVICLLSCGPAAPHLRRADLVDHAIPLFGQLAVVICSAPPDRPAALSHRWCSAHGGAVVVGLEDLRILIESSTVAR